MELHNSGLAAFGHHQSQLKSTPVLGSTLLSQAQQQPITASHYNSKRREYQIPAAPQPLPIDDFDLLETPNKYSDDERQLRIKLAAVYRLIELNGWSMGIYNHVTVSTPPLFAHLSPPSSRSCLLVSGRLLEASGNENNAITDCTLV